MKIVPIPISLNENTVQKESDSINDTAGSIEEQYNELVEINELLCGKLNGDIRTCYLSASRAIENDVNSANNKLKGTACVMKDYTKKMVVTNRNAETLAGGGKE